MGAKFRSIMAGKKIKPTEKKFSLVPQFPKYAGYADYFLSTPVSVQVKNDAAEAARLRVFIESESGLIVPYETTAEVPFESAVSLTAEGIFSPLFLAENDRLSPCAVTVRAELDGKEVCREQVTVTALPFDWWEGLEGNAARLAAFVRPRLADCAAVLEDAGKRLKRWQASTEFSGYEASDKNEARQVAAAVYAAVKSFSIERAEPSPLSAPVSAAREGSLIKEHLATELELAVFAAACLEAAHLNPVLAVGKEHVGVGAWLYGSCFLEGVTDDADIVNKYISEGINNLSFFDVSDLYAVSNAAFTPSEGHFRQKLKAGCYEVFVDIRRCRMDGVRACPLRGRGLKGYELLKEEEMTDDAAPAPIPVFRKLKLEGKQPKNKQWERRLLDLTPKNTLLNFTGKNALHLNETGADAFYGVLASRGHMRLKGAAAAETVPPFGGEVNKQRRELIALEQQKGILRAYDDPRTVSELAARLMRRNREADEETGAKVLYLAFGFLKYTADGAVRHAPLVLAPVGLGRAKGNEDFSVTLSADEGYFVNTTLLEYLKQEFNIDVRGLGTDVSALKIAELLAMVRAEIANMKGWDVTGDVYLAAFSFQRYLMWNDIRNHFQELSKNALVKALLNNRMERADYPAPAEEDDGDPEETLLPLPSDSSQYSAVSLSGVGASFVLHGPPGTGKSQTITNIIANALKDGKRVLFVAEKKAALDVVKKRLDTIGIGEFCLELHSNKTDKSDVLRRFESTLALAKAALPALSEKAKELSILRDELKAPMQGLHAKRRLGISVYQAILGYLQNKSAPDVMDIESSFYDTLDEKKLFECRRMISAAAAAAKECGGVKNSPFENVNLTAYSQTLRDRVYCASEVLLAESKHLKAFLALFLEFYRQKVSTLTIRKIRILAELAKKLSANIYDKYFKDVGEAEFFTFYNANRRLDFCLEYYNKSFKTLIGLDKEELEELAKLFEAGGDWRLNRTAKSAAKKLTKAAKETLDEEDIPKYLQTVVEIYAAADRIRHSTSLSKAFCDRAGNIIYKKRTEFLADLYGLHDRAAVVFMDYNADSFNGMCIRATSGYTVPVLEGYIEATEAYFRAQESFLAVTQADGNKLREEDMLDDYSGKASALIDNIDMLPNWCMYRDYTQKLAGLGLTFVAEALESGRLKTDNVLAGFEKNVYRNFLEINIPADPALSRMTVGTLEETIEKFRHLWDDYGRVTREYIRALLISRLPDPDGEGSLSVELSAFTRLSKSNLRGTGLRGLFGEVPTLMSVVCPCMLMSPITVAQYLKPVADQFDLVIFDEASQMTTAEAIGSIARAKAAVVVGDPKQLPPTAFFHTAYVDEENLENEDLESILDDCLALGMPERHLVWHYRSKHESLIAFSNSMYYDNRLCTFPSPDAMDSKVRLCLVDGTYDRGFTKRNRKEAEALVREVVRRLSDPVLSKSSMGVVTFSSAQRDDIERLLNREIAAKRLDAAAYDREEPLFIKNLENVQGDERDVILFSVCYGPDGMGRVSLNFGPLNQAGGWRRLNVAVSRAREEMLVFSTMTSSMIDLAKTSSKGVAGLKAFLEFAEKGRTTLAAPSASVRGGAGIGKFIAEELSAVGYECRYDVGASDCKVDVAVIDPKNKHRFLLGVLCDGTDKFSVKDRNILQPQTLKRANWNVMRVNCVNYYNNPKREIKRIKEVLDKLTGADGKAGSWIAKYGRPYKSVKPTSSEVAAFVTGGVNDGEILARIREIVALEEPISRPFLRKRVLQTFGIQKSGSKVESKIDALIDGSGAGRDRVMGTDYFYKNPKAILIGRFRLEGETVLRKTEDDFSVYEIVSLVKGALEDRVALYMDELSALVQGVYPDLKMTEHFQSFLRECVAFGEEKGLFVRSVSDRISLA